MAERLRKKLYAMKNTARAKVLAGFFKTGKGEYGEGDRFLGIKVPMLRGLISEERERVDALTLREIESFLESHWHEERLFGILILILRYEEGDEKAKDHFFTFYKKMAKRGFVNNWDFVDHSAPAIAGEWIWRRDRDLFDSWVDSKILWERRIAVVATQTLIGKGEFQKTLEYCERLLDDQEDLMHKACGWMLREVGKKDEKVLKGFLERFSLRMPRTMLRYAIERFPEKERKEWLTRSPC